jgi:hypothetical protein
MWGAISLDDRNVFDNTHKKDSSSIKNKQESNLVTNAFLLLNLQSIIVSSALKTIMTVNMNTA